MTSDHPAQNPAEAEPFGDLAANVEGDLELLGELASVFLRECSEMMGNIQDAIERRNSSDMEKTAHKLKGCVGVFTNRGPFECALHLEMMGRENNLAGADPAFCELEDQMRAFIAEIKKYVPHTGV